MSGYHSAVRPFPSRRRSRRGSNRKKWCKTDKRQLLYQKVRWHITYMSLCVISFAATLASRGCSRASLRVTHNVACVTHRSGCENEVLAVPWAYCICMMGWPWVTNRRYDAVPGRSEQFLHCGGDGAGWEQQPTSLLPTWGTEAHVKTLHFAQNMINKALERKSESSSQRSDCGLWICSEGHWSNFPGRELDMCSNLRLIAVAPCHWRTCIQVFVL